MARVNGGTITSTDRTLTRSGLTSGSALAPVSAVLLSTRAPIGYTALLSTPTAFNQGCKALVPQQALVEPRYLQYSLISRGDNLRAAGSGSTFLELSSEALARHEIHLAGLDEQRRITEFLDDRISQIDRIIAARLKQISLLKGQYKSVLQEHIDALGRRYGWTQLRRLGLTIEQGWSPEADSTPALPDSPGVLKLGAVRGGSFHPKENKGFLDGTSPKHENLLYEGNLLMTRANTPALVGDVAVVDGLPSSPLYLSDLIYRLHVTDMEHSLVSAALRTVRARQEIGIIARGTSGSMPKLRGADIAGLLMPTVPSASQVDAGLADVCRREERDQRVKSLDMSIDLLREYKSALITAAVTGELDVPTAGSSIPG